MDAKTPQRPTARAGFTLVELLVVIIIIAMLAGLVITAGGAAMRAAKRATIGSEIQQLNMALERYKSECGDYPPDCFSATDLANDGDAQNAIIRHFRKRFPRYRPGAYGDKLGLTYSNLGSTSTEQNWNKLRLDAYNATSSGSNATNPSSINNATGMNLNDLNPSSALAFFLGGMPSDGKPDGFSANPSIPFTPGGSRTSSFFEFDETRYEVADNIPKYVPKHIKSPANSSEGVPYVYFRARSGGYGTTPSAIPYVTLTGDSGSCTPYAREIDAAAGKIDWYKPKSYQIIAAGLDGEFGAATYKDSSGNPAEVSFPLNNDDTNVYDGWKMARYFNANDNNLWQTEDDNLSSFTPGQLEDGVQ